MADSALDEVTQQLSKTSVNPGGVSFQGRSLKLNSEDDCKEVVDAIDSCKDLSYLNLEGNTLGVDAAKAVSKALEKKSELKRALWKDMFTGRMKTEIPKALLHLSSGLELAGAQLSELDLSDNAFGPIGVEGLAGLLSSRACYSLQELRLNNNGLGITGGKMLAKALLECHKNSSAAGKPLALKVFIAGRNRLENEGAKALSEVFQTLGTLEEIAMPQNGIYHVGISALSKALAQNPNLQVLNLNDNTLTSKGAASLADALPHLQHLRVLNLGDCLLKTKGAVVLAEALSAGHKELEELHLESNEIGTTGGLSLALAVENKDKLTKLELNGNQFGEKGSNLVREELKASKHIDTLGSLSEDEDAEDDEEEQSSEGEEEDDEEEDEEDKEESREETKEEAAVIPTPAVKSPRKGSELETFMATPTRESYLKLERRDLEEYLKTSREYGTEMYIDRFIPLLMKLSSISSNQQSDVQQLCLGLYQELFVWAQDKNQLLTVNNAIFVHLGLIKSEDKQFKINWNVKNCLEVLKVVIEQGLAPGSTQDILECCLDKEAAEPEVVTLS